MTFTPAASASRTACVPGNAGSSAGWVLISRPPNASRKSGPTSFMKPAETTRSGSYAGDLGGQRAVPGGPVGVVAHARRRSRRCPRRAGVLEPAAAAVGADGDDLAPGRPGSSVGGRAARRTASRFRTAARRPGPAAVGTAADTPATLAGAPGAHRPASAQRPPAGNGGRDRGGDPALRGHGDARGERRGTDLGQAAVPERAAGHPHQQPADHAEQHARPERPVSPATTDPPSPSPNHRADRRCRRRGRRAPGSPATRRRSAARPGCRAARPAAAAPARRRA